MEKFPSFKCKIRKPSALPMSSTEARTCVGTQIPRQPLFIILLLPLQYRREINDLVFFFKCFKNIYKLNIFNYVSFRSCSKPLRNVDPLTLDVFKNSFFFRICSLWNELPLSIRESTSLSILRKNLLAFYYDKFNVDFFLILHCFSFFFYSIISPVIVILLISVYVACFL